MVDLSAAAVKSRSKYQTSEVIIMEEVKVTGSTFKAEVLDSDKPVIADFYADWCGPCKMLSPVLSEIAKENPDIKICKINVDDEPDLASQFGVMSIPFVACFKNGNLYKSSVGFQTKEAILELTK